MSHRVFTAPLVPLLAGLALAGCSDSKSLGKPQQLLTVSTAVTGHGRITPTKVRVSQDKPVQLTLQPDEGYKVQSATGCGGFLEGKIYWITKVTANCTVSATFVAAVSPEGVTALYPENGRNWNDYVRNDGANALQASDTACTAGDNGHYSACLHGGDRRVFRVPALETCQDANATDMLEAFDWTCDMSEGYARFSSRLKESARVADLIDFSAARWKDNKVTVRSGATEVAARLAPWWQRKRTSCGLKAPLTPTPASTPSPWKRCAFPCCARCGRATR